MIWRAENVNTSWYCGVTSGLWFLCLNISKMAHWPELKKRKAELLLRQKFGGSDAQISNRLKWTAQHLGFYIVDYARGQEFCFQG